VGTITGKADLGRVGHKARLGDDHFVAGVEDGGHGQVERFADAHGDDDFVGRVVGDAV
jgi:hypothetical protein